ncbi:thiamine pyrophosphate-binding protein [Pelagibacterium halotolerans]|uniref:Thiamine pyrophosphate-requiring enzyme n=1 Tax=Pelagibacterium halotolerans (strain DSM 22347 / JCM 15775 / CGMCC 1.7692 / B2) TaxID=1082931 RepID=G4RD28_PELHB|nr:thiamine pyrophosphate-binding protein [Pelagibacterium halotolerans]AEQ53778.1 thiamine pyrophosphate-requiring enzyme [Pelagibacterium halotolerans B2]QJR20063.1 thiamine pyrophosphate-binding protein [Pelagibacterium halotolerans]SEA80838.1 acetolactate synthase-1/2/3 large subunit [Pelagibacterium halotolerans]
MTRNGGQLLVESLVALGAQKAFGVPGESYLAVLDALHDTRGKLDYILCRNEGGASFMAAAYGKLMGEPGICMVTRGPGATNASIGVHTAMQDSAPMILFVGQVGTDMKGREAFQELDYRAVFGTMAKWTVEIDHADRIPEILSRAWLRAKSGRPGPVVVALPEDMLTSMTEAAPLSAPLEISEPAPDRASMDNLRRLLAEAERPLIMLGGCNWSEGSTAAIQAFAEASNIPVAAVFRYQDQFDNSSPVFVGEMGVGMTPHIRKLVKQADLVLAINNRFGEMSTDGYTLFDVPQPAQTLIHVHGSDLEIGKVYRPALAIQAGPNAFAAALGEMAAVRGTWSAWRSEARQAYEKGFELPDLPSPVDMGKVCAIMRDKLPEDFILTNGAGNFTVWPGKFFRYGPGARLLAPQSGAMGYGVPASIAAKVACPDRTVVCFAGDGDFQMNCQELATALQADAQPIILILNNGIYGTIRAHQERNYPARVSGTTMDRNPDFVALARAYGFHAEKVETTGDFEAAFDRALASRTGAVLELVISPEALTPRQTLSEMRDAALRAKETA